MKWLGFRLKNIESLVVTNLLKYATFNFIDHPPYFAQLEAVN